jgi:hypothetical protein
MSEADLLQPENIVRERWKVVSEYFHSKFSSTIFPKFRLVKSAVVALVRSMKQLI